MSFFQFFCGRELQQVKHQIDTGFLFGDIILKVGVKPFVTQVKLNGKTNQQHITLKVIQLENLLHRIKPQLDTFITSCLVPARPPNGLLK